MVDEAAARRIRGNRVVAFVAVLAMFATIFFWFWENRTKHHMLRISAGDALGHRHDLVETLRSEANHWRLGLDIVPMVSTQAALEKIRADELDVALIGGERSEAGTEEHVVRQVTTLVIEPLHLFVKPELLEGGIAGLRGKRLNLAHIGTGTHNVARRVLEFAGLRHNQDFIELNHSYTELASLDDSELPDGIFALTPLPWRLGTTLVRKHGYRLMELPFGDALALHETQLRDMVIPAFSYSALPPVPDRALHTVATPLLIVANKDVPSGAIERLLDVIYESDFARQANLPPLNSGSLSMVREFPLHQGITDYLRRNEPVLNGQVIGNLENLRSFLVSAAVSLFLIWRWYSRRQLIGFESYFDSVTDLEREAHTSHRNGKLDPIELERMRQRLSEIKAEALERHAEGILTDEDQLVSFLTHVGDVRSSLDSLETRLRFGATPRRSLSSSPGSPYEAAD